MLSSDDHTVEYFLIVCPWFFKGLRCSLSVNMSDIWSKWGSWDWCCPGVCAVRRHRPTTFVPVDKELRGQVSWVLVTCPVRSVILHCQHPNSPTRRNIHIRTCHIPFDHLPCNTRVQALRGSIVSSPHASSVLQNAHPRSDSSLQIVRLYHLCCPPGHGTSAPASSQNMVSPYRFTQSALSPWVAWWWYTTHGMHRVGDQSFQTDETSSSYYSHVVDRNILPSLSPCLLKFVGGREEHTPPTTTSRILCASSCLTSFQVLFSRLVKTHY
jgi:hypothetical protein